MKKHHIAALLAALSLSVSPLATMPAGAQSDTKPKSGSQTETQFGTSPTGTGSSSQADQSQSGSSTSGTDCTHDATGACPRGKAQKQRTDGEGSGMQKKSMRPSSDGSASDGSDSGKTSTEMKARSGSQDTSGGASTEQKPEPGTGDAAAGSKSGMQGSNPSETQTKVGGTSRQSTDQNAATTNKNSTDATVSNTTTNNKTNVNVTVEQRTEIHQVIKEVHVAPVREVNFTISVGTRIPKKVRLEQLPPRIVKIVPAYEGYRFFLLADGRIVIVDPHALTIVYIIDA